MKTTNHQNRILIVVATTLEMAPLLSAYGNQKYLQPGEIVSLPDADLLITGPGIAATVYHTTLAIHNNRYTLLINAGVAGSYNPVLTPGTVCLVRRDRFADLGAESPEGFIPGEQFAFTLLDHNPYSNGWLEPEIPEEHIFTELPHANAITSDTVHTLPDSILKLVSLWNPDLESMEGAAFFYTCMKAGVPCAQVRSVSNSVGPRDNDKWHLTAAVATLNRFLDKLISKNE
ncbi:MAG: futalosine hydrolase [Bacteroidales bacterium]